MNNELKNAVDAARQLVGVRRPLLQKLDYLDREMLRTHQTIQALCHTSIAIKDQLISLEKFRDAYLECLERIDENDQKN